MTTQKILKNVIVKFPYEERTATLDLEKGEWISKDPLISQTLNDLNPPHYFPGIGLTMTYAQKELLSTQKNYPEIIVVERIEEEVPILLIGDRVV